MSNPNFIIPPGSLPAITPPGEAPRPVFQPPPTTIAPQPVGTVNSPGKGPGFSLADHVHKVTFPTAGLSEVRCCATWTNPNSDSLSEAFGLNFDVIDEDPSGLWGVTTGAYGLQVPRGLYLVAFQISAQSSDNGNALPEMEWQIGAGVVRGGAGSKPLGGQITSGRNVKNCTIAPGKNVEPFCCAAGLIWVTASARIGAFFDVVDPNTGIDQTVIFEQAFMEIQQLTTTIP